MLHPALGRPPSPGVGQAALSMFDGRKDFKTYRPRSIPLIAPTVHRVLAFRYAIFRDLGPTMKPFGRISLGVLFSREPECIATPGASCVGLHLTFPAHLVYSRTAHRCAEGSPPGAAANHSPYVTGMISYIHHIALSHRKARLRNWIKASAGIIPGRFVRHKDALLHHASVAKKLRIMAPGSFVL